MTQDKQQSDKSIFTFLQFIINVKTGPYSPCSMFASHIYCIHYCNMINIVNVTYSPRNLNTYTEPERRRGDAQSYCALVCFSHDTGRASRGYLDRSPLLPRTNVRIFLLVWWSGGSDSAFAICAILLLLS